MNLIIVSPVLTDFEGSGHTYWAYKILRENARSRGISNLTFGPKAVEVEGVYNLLRVRDSEHGRYVKNSRASIRDLTSIIKEKTNSENLLFHFYDGGVADVFFLRKLMRIYPKGVFLLNFHWANNVIRIFDRKDHLSRLQVKRIVSVFQKLQSRLILSAESDSLAKICTSKFGFKVMEYPNFSIFESEIRLSRSNDFIVVSSEISEIRRILSCIGKIKKEKSKVSVAIIANKGMKQTESLKFEFNNLQLRIIQESLTYEEYREIHLDSKVLVLPYFEEFYKWGSSGRVCDAAVLGCNVVVPSDLELAKRSSKLGIGYPFNRNDPESLESALNAAWSAGCVLTLEDTSPDIENALKWMQSSYSKAIEKGSTKHVRFLNFDLLILKVLIFCGWNLTKVRHFVSVVLERKLARKK